MADLARRLAGAGGRRTGPVRGRLRGARHRLPDQVQRLAPRLLAAHDLRGGERARRRDPRHPEQGRRLRRDAPEPAPVRRRACRPASARPGSSPAGLATMAYGTLGILGRARPHPGRGLRRDDLVRHGAGRPRALAAPRRSRAPCTTSSARRWRPAPCSSSPRSCSAAAPGRRPSKRVFADEYRDPFDDADAIEIGRAIPGGGRARSGSGFLALHADARRHSAAGRVRRQARDVHRTGRRAAITASAWWLIAALTLSSFGTLTPLVRLGIQNLWVPSDDPPPVPRGTSEFLAPGRTARRLSGPRPLGRPGPRLCGRHRPLAGATAGLRPRRSRRGPGRRGP